MSNNEAKAEAFIKNVLNESGDAHGVFTPFALCDDVINKLPSLDGNILVVANLEFLYTLARRGVNLSRLFFATPNDTKARAAEQMGIGRVYKYNNVPTKEDLGNMKFDVVVGNPPYSIPIDGEGRTAGTKTRLYATFFANVFLHAPNYAIVLPSNWIGRENDSVRSAIINDPDVKWIYDTSEHFNGLIKGTPTCVVIKEQGYNSQIKLIQHEQADAAPYEVPSSVFTSLSVGPYVHIFEKLAAHRPMSTLWRRNVNTGLTRSSDLISQTPTNFPVVLVTGPKGKPATTGFSTCHVDQKDIDSVKVIMNTNASINDIGAIKIVEPGYYTTDSIVFFPADDAQTAENIRQYLSTSLVRFIVRTIRNSHGNSRAFFAKVPRVDFARSWTDEELYEHFQLTTDEIKLIEDTVK